MTKIIMMRSVGIMHYFNLIEYFILAVVGKRHYKENVCDKRLSNYATVSNKAFAILIFKNNFHSWLDMGKKG